MSVIGRRRGRGQVTHSIIVCEDMWYPFIGECFISEARVAYIYRMSDIQRGLCSYPRWQ